ncbi:MAG: hypothetical protein ABIT83_27145 [Massilia sp.]
MKRTLEKLTMGAFMVTALVMFGWYSMHKPTILVLHSYDPDYAWVRDVNTGLKRVLNQRHLYQVHWYYMDTKRHPFDDYKRSAGIAARKVIEATQPDVVIAIDDDAQQYAARYFNDHPKVKIVFAGVNREAGDYGYDHASNVTGILERIPLDAVQDALRSAEQFKKLGRPVRLAFLGDQSETVKGDIRQVQHFDWRPLEMTAMRQVASWPEWQASVMALGADNDALLVSGYRRLARSASDRALVPPEEVVAWTEAHSPVPVVSFNAFYIEEGGMLAIGTSPFEQGEVAGRRALDVILKRQPPRSLPVAVSGEFVVSMNGTKMRARHFVLPRIYEAAARAGDLYLP